MNSYERLVDFAENIGIEVVEKHFKSSAKGLCKGNKVGISKAIDSTVEKRCILAEEIAHSLYTVGNILDQNNLFNIKQEEYARKQAYEALLPLPLLIDAWHQGVTSQHELAEYLEVTEEFLLSSLCHYQKKYGVYVRHGKYMVRFLPLMISEVTHNIAM